MPLPELNEKGELPEGVYPSTFDELIQRFGSGSTQRKIVTKRLEFIFQLTKSTGCLNRIVVFGSYVTDKPEPNDVDVVIVFDDTFDIAKATTELKTLLDHSTSEELLGASIFWIRPELLFLETLEDFIASWQTKRDTTKRGIVEVIP